MGWLKIKHQALVSHFTEQPDRAVSLKSQGDTLGAALQTVQEPLSDLASLKPSIQHIESISTEQVTALPPQVRPFASTDTPDKDLPFIPSSEIKAKQIQKDVPERIWIVIDTIVYDCSVFVNNHPGGDTVIKAFTGSDCSWQFWRFHGKEHLEEFGRSLRIGRTAKIQNRFQEPPKYVGLRRFNSDADEW
ncbi:hypothetical protein W97_02972 [Coniosporium apollinis CBS 100218]|uniref:Cytochrome b5 heme-binding domain-containing protein n=1 Tax=Coniosporium apollinis (strain CBS 100218) TaxID=1168221 RepID=R7YPK4_CONA1|nr:uncharacterized protein W97_02972 [Coniosporium apollinis CBS 100218]EON63744.1 hypothetical protein W97_02972 [Coniosporium apollinis CBS 100218]